MSRRSLSCHFLAVASGDLHLGSTIPFSGIAWTTLHSYASSFFLEGCQSYRLKPLLTQGGVGGQAHDLDYVCKGTLFQKKACRGFRTLTHTAFGDDIIPLMTVQGRTSRRAQRIIYFYNQGPRSINFSYLENLTYPYQKTQGFFMYMSQAIFSWVLALQNLGRKYFYLFSVIGPSLAKY